MSATPETSLPSSTPPLPPSTVDQNTAATASVNAAAPELNGADPEPLRNLIVNYLPPLMNDVQLWQLFGQFGPIESVKIIYDRETHESRGYGFVKFHYFFSATYAILCLNRFEIAGKTLKVAYANVTAAKEAYDVMRVATTAFNVHQRAALERVYYDQILTREQEAAAGTGGW